MIQSGILQNLIPVFPFTRRQASFEDQITPSCSEGDARDSFANHLHQIASRVIGVEIVAAFDADDAGRNLVEMIRETVAGIALRTGRSDLIFEIGRASCRERV